MSNLCVFGDSITWGSWDPEKGGWVQRLKTCLESEFDSEINIFNLGVPGDTTVDLLSRFKAESAARKPDKIIFAIGINDSKYLKKQKSNLVSVSEFEKNLKTLIKQAQDFTPDIVFLGLTLVDEEKIKSASLNWDAFYEKETIETYNEVIKKVAEEFGLIFIDLQGELNLSDLDDEDGLHPNAAGHQKIFEAVKEKIISKI